ncbi:Vesicle-associated membrane protein 2 [Papilio machaon]|uniref:Vesicle-associated membrane protein 2 n=1 Tax=Papilio machaon TaxID=76193 RepID=A0A194RPH8_PAPMA|nr:Vesicle-associated membrane protein 2 [Papilio machaon]
MNEKQNGAKALVCATVLRLASSRYAAIALSSKLKASEGETPGGLAPAEPQTGPDGEIIGGPRTPQQIAAQRRLQQTQAQVDEVVDIMKSNVEKVLDRDAKLSELDDRANALQQGASQFEQQAKSLKNKFWLQNLKMMIIMGVIGLAIIGLLFGDDIKEMFG